MHYWKINLRVKVRTFKIISKFNVSPIIRNLDALWSYTPHYTGSAGGATYDSSEKSMKRREERVWKRLGKLLILC